MNRREAVTRLIVIAGGITLIPACLNSPGKSSVALKYLDISHSQEVLLAEIAGTIIPKTTSDGAKEIGAHLFVLKMVDDCYDTADQQNFVKGLNDLDKLTNYSFLESTPVQREQILLSLENRQAISGQIPSEKMSRFYAIMKQETIQAYMTSKYVLDNVVKYEMIPSKKYNGYYPVKNLKDGRQA